MDTEVAETFLNFHSPPSVGSYSSPGGGYRGANDSGGDVFMTPVSTMDYSATVTASRPPQAPAIFAANHFDGHGQPYLTNGRQTMGLNCVSAGDYQYETIEAQLDFDSLEMLLTEPLPSDLGPPPVPVRQPRPSEDPPRNKESAYAPTTPPNGRDHLTIQRYSLSTETNSSEIRRTRTMYSAPAEGQRSRDRIRKRTGRADHFKRASSPMFPDNSVPLSRLSSSNASLNSIKSDPFGTISSRHSGPAFSDPGVYAVNVTRHQDSDQNSPALSVPDANSPRFNFGQTQGSSHSVTDAASTTRSSLEVEVPVKYARRISELDKRILKLQAERSKMLEKASQISKPDAPTNTFWQDDKWPIQMSEKSSEFGRIHLYVFPLGVHALDEPLFEESNTILRHIGGLYYDLQTSIRQLRKVCYKGMLYQPDISTCFAYIKSLMQEHQRLKVTAPVNGLYMVEVDMDPGTSTLVPPEFEHSLEVANQVLRSALIITQSYTHVQMKLQSVQAMATDKVHRCDAICQELGILDRERRNQIRMVLEGNATAVSSALRTWPQHFQFATETIRAIVECIHPSS